MPQSARFLVLSDLDKFFYTLLSHKDTLVKNDNPEEHSKDSEAPLAISFSDVLLLCAGPPQGLLTIAPEYTDVMVSHKVHYLLLLPQDFPNT